MTNIFPTPEKVEIRARLTQAAVQALESQGWKVQRGGTSKSSVWRATKNGISKMVSIRTTQDQWIAFPRNESDDAWATLADVDYVVAASVDSRENPQFALVHLIDGNEMRARFDRAYAARLKAGYKKHVGRGIWLSLYEEEAAQPVTLVGAGAGLANKEIARIPLFDTHKKPTIEKSDLDSIEKSPLNREPLSIPEAKRRLALTFGVSESDIKITISS